MKNLFLLVLLSFNSMASNWMPISKAVPGATTAYQIESECRRSGEDCIDVGDNLEAIRLGMFEIQDSEMDGKQVVIHASEWNDHKSELNQNAQLEAGVARAIRAQDCGRRVIALLVVRNAPKSLTPQQVAQMSQSYGSTQDLLLNGSLDTAKGLISSVTADGTIVTNGDKTALMAEIDKCKPQ